MKLFISFTFTFKVLHYYNVINVPNMSNELLSRIYDSLTNHKNVIK